MKSLPRRNRHRAADAVAGFALVVAVIVAEGWKLARRLTRSW